MILGDGQGPGGPILGQATLFMDPLDKKEHIYTPPGWGWTPGYQIRLDMHYPDMKSAYGNKVMY